MCRLQRSYVKYGPGGADPQAGGASRLSSGHEAGGLLQASLGRPLDVGRGRASGRRSPLTRPASAPADPGVPQCRGTALQGLCGPQGCPGPDKGPLPHCPGPLSPRPHPCTPPPLVYLHHRSAPRGLLEWNLRTWGGCLWGANENKSFAGGLTESKNGGGGDAWKRSLANKAVSSWREGV